MGRPKVPHCEECRDYKKSKNGRYGYCIKKEKWLNAQEKRTSPKWCPERNKMIRW